MSLPILRPGQTHAAVPKLKRALVKELGELGRTEVAATIRVDGKTYGGRAVAAVKQFQEAKELTPDGIVGERTWHALGFDDPVVDERQPVLHGVPWEPGVTAVDGIWVDDPLAHELLEQRRAGRWRGNVNSGYRPAWYQKRLFDAAVKKYGSVQAASKWVAPPGKSRHGQKGGNGAVDVEGGEQLDAASQQLYRPMSWEPWHMQLTGARDVPDDLDEDRDVEISEPSAKELEAHGLTLEDVDETIEVLLERLDAQNRAAEDAQPS
jgi:Putative peptidoglycan binding domain/D-alanyl-D-alanine carboxypeptidase